MLGLFGSEDRLFGVEAGALGELALIETLEPFLSPLPEVVGAITLRGNVIPVLDPVALCGLSPRRTVPGIAAVIWNDTGMVALAIDRIVELRRFHWDELQKIEGRTEHPVLRGHLTIPGGTANILDVGRLFDRAEIPRASRSQRNRFKKDQRGLIPHLTFQSGGINYAVDVKNIFNTVPRRPIENTDIASGPFLGNITYLQRRIPVVETNMVMNIQASRQNLLPEIVVLRMNDKRLLGLAVDQILQISYFEQSRLPPLQAHLRSSAPLIKSTLSDPDAGSNVLVLDADAIQTIPSLNELANLSAEDSVAPAGDPVLADREGSIPSNIIRERVRNLVFLAGREFAAPVHGIANIIGAPRDVIPWQTSVCGLIGLFSFEGTMVPLVDLACHLGEEATGDSHQKRVLMTGADDRKVGFLVDRISGLSLSVWRTRPDGNAPDDFDMTQIQEWPKDRIVARVDLNEISLSVSRQFGASAARDLMPQTAPSDARREA